MTTFAVPDHDAPAIGAARMVAVSRASRSDAIGAVGLLIGTLGVLLALSLVLGGPLAGVR
jgi:hypothetical protein